MRVTVGDDCIRDGIPNRCNACPIALAVWEAWGRDRGLLPVSVFVEPHGVTVLSSQLERLSKFQSSRTLARWMKVFDEGRESYPFSFVLKPVDPSKDYSVV